MKLIYLLRQIILTKCLSLLKNKNKKLLRIQFYYYKYYDNCVLNSYILKVIPKFQFKCKKCII